GTVANLAVGQALSIAGRFSNSSLSGVEFNLQAIQPTEPGILHMSGIVSNVTPTSFMLNGVTIQRNGVAIPGGGMMGGNGMMGGSRVNVNVQLIDGQYRAIAISALGG
ncbi:MAG: hypothetical protein WC100_18110, partial [Sterolibacterium sp.]